MKPCSDNPRAQLPEILRFSAPPTGPDVKGNIKSALSPAPPPHAGEGFKSELSLLVSLSRLRERVGERALLLVIWLLTSGPLGGAEKRRGEGVF